MHQGLELDGSLPCREAMPQFLRGLCGHLHLSQGLVGPSLMGPSASGRWGKAPDEASWLPRSLVLRPGKQQPSEPKWRTMCRNRAAERDVGPVPVPSWHPHASVTPAVPGSALLESPNADRRPHWPPPHGATWTRGPLHHARGAHDGLEADSPKCPMNQPTRAADRGSEGEGP